ncbi:11S globulin seed storage protein Ana o 2.0101-like [Salvia miltiorrhiza]|uniref:11S globulin seed storage protein Ana o 2.0101-like n=1 Tax=Salvia miltiorrhiza TaxID=226208 RepID=UPI0025AD041F|nr:11S globulin seed storage protein Ana o 2.0101-like [Salvia miltiorrhiza]
MCQSHTLFFSSINLHHLFTQNSSPHYTLPVISAMGRTFLSALGLVLLLSSASAYKGSAGSWQRGECDISRINTQEPSSRLESEGGVSEFWDHNADEFRCAGVSFHRHTIRSRGLMLPAYHNAPVLAYVIQGRGIFGVLISGCPETFESPQQQSAERQRGEKFTDRHQQIEYLKQGDVIAIRAGDAHWAYNNGDEELVVVVLQDNSNNANQLDQNPRSFLLAGNPERQQQMQHQQRFRGQEQQHQLGNVFRGFRTELLAEVFEVDEETARKLKSENDERGPIVIVEKELQVIKPPVRRHNGLEETACSAKIRENIDSPSRADIYNPQAGRLSTVNGFTFPLLNYLQLSFAKAVLYKNAIMAPYWFTNAHSILYITRGENRIQVVNQHGQAVFDGQVREGQVLVVPQNFAVVKQAGEQGCEWVQFNTNANAMLNTLSGRTSALRGLPVDVVANSYQISREEAERIKFSREETLFFRGSRSSGRRSVVASA